jgi:hypothetical protein
MMLSGLRLGDSFNQSISALDGRNNSRRFVVYKLSLSIGNSTAAQFDQSIDVLDTIERLREVRVHCGASEGMIERAREAVFNDTWRWKPLGYDNILQLNNDG